MLTAARHDGALVDPDPVACILDAADPAIRPVLLAAAVPMLPRRAFEHPAAWSLPEPAPSRPGQHFFVRDMGALAAAVHRRLGSMPGLEALFFLRRSLDMARRASVAPAVPECSAVIAAHCDDQAIETLVRTLAAEAA